jgi:hypothetical protein
MATARGIGPVLKADLLTRTPSVTAKSPPTCSRVLTLRRGAGSHTSCGLTRNGRSQIATHEACNRTAVISIPPSTPKPVVERADHRAGSM